MNEPINLAAPNQQKRGFILTPSHEEMDSTGRKLPHSFEARFWAKEFVKYVKETPSIPTDEETMTTWFANALMAGYDWAKKNP
jgi:hypothetical protein